MHTEESPRLRMLRMLLAMDATLLFFLGALMIVMPHWIEKAFHFPDLPMGVGYLVGLWGCALVTVAIGCIIAALDPVKNVAWVQVNIARGALECAFGFICLFRGLVTWEQAGLGIIAAAVFTFAYSVLYPSKA